MLRKSAYPNKKIVLDIYKDVERDVEGVGPPDGADELHGLYPGAEGQARERRAQKTPPRDGRQQEPDRQEHGGVGHRVGA